MNARRLTSLLVSGFFLASFTAAASTPVVYDFDTGPGVVKFLDTVDNTVRLYLDAGAIPSGGSEIVCESGLGDELCAIDLTGTIVSFSAGPGVVHDPDSPFAPTSKLRLNVLKALPPHLSGPQDLGTLTLDMSTSTSTNGTKVEASGQVVDATGNLQTIPTQTIALPEPSQTLLLVSGVLGLALLYRLRGVA